MNRILKIIEVNIFVLFFGVSFLSISWAQSPAMKYADDSRDGISLSKDPHVIYFKGRYLMYYSLHGYTDAGGVVHGWGIGIAESDDLIHWKRAGEVNADPFAAYEKKGFAAPCALVKDDKVHLFYQKHHKPHFQSNWRLELWQSY